MLSLPEITSFCSLPSEVDTSCLGMPVRIHVDSPANMERSSSDQQTLADLPICAENDSELEASAENATQEILVEVNRSILIGGDEVGLILNADDDGKLDKTSDNLDNQPMLENSSTSHHQQEVELATDACVKQTQPSPNSVLDSHPSEFFITEEADSELKLKLIDFNELDSLVNMPCGKGGMTEIENVTILSKHFDSSDLPHVQVDKKDESDFNFVRDVLKLSGFSGDEKLRTWHLPDQPIDPSLFEEVDCCRQDTGSNCDHQLLFDVVNEVLVDIYERSFMYWPRPLSTNLNIRPLPIGFHVLEEVWASISWFLSYQRELDDIASHDLAKADGWTNLQFESECAGLELEEWIWDELLEEVILELEVA
ncbi:protein TRM32-like [Telopea speciosissima]|uniref:protein TRM32-like n=1 Tax=Telopea speciosissima TaxID=54955 RepID=UPI001CC4A532|nr:protein TRM32-like [Telopea speciosissima]